MGALSRSGRNRLLAASLTAAAASAPLGLLAAPHRSTAARGPRHHAPHYPASSRPAPAAVSSTVARRSPGPSVPSLAFQRTRGGIDLEVCARGRLSAGAVRLSSTRPSRARLDLPGVRLADVSVPAPPRRGVLRR